MGLKLESLYIRSFKCYENSGKIPFHNLTVFIGENDAGKSTIYDALDLLLNNNQPSTNDYRDGSDSIEIDAHFTCTETMDELSSYIINNTVIIKIEFSKNICQNKYLVCCLKKVVLEQE